MRLKMTHLCNFSENFVREVRYMLLYDATSISFNENLKGIKPQAGKHLLKIEITPNSFSRNISLKTKNKNDYFDIKLQFPVYELSFENRQLLYTHHKKRAYVVVLVSNTEISVFGNAREPMSLSVDDAILDNASGKDSFSISISGQTIIFPKQAKITEPFRVLLFMPPRA